MYSLHPDAPLLHLAERLQLGDGDEDDNSFLSATDIDLAGCGDLQCAELGLEFWDVVFEVDQSLSDVGFCLIGRCGGRVGGAEDLVVNGHLDG